MASKRAAAWSGLMGRDRGLKQSGFTLVASCLASLCWDVVGQRFRDRQEHRHQKTGSVTSATRTARRRPANGTVID